MANRSEYEAFLARKRLTSLATGIDNPPVLSGRLFSFQRDITRWALRRGRAALFEECGLGKSWQALEWSRVVSEHTESPVLILTPLAVAQQFVREGEKLGVSVKLCRERGDMGPGVNVTNYDRVERFDVSALGGVVLDESSILKAYDGKTRNALIGSFAHVPFRLACTATPAPNDHEELGNHAEFLGVMTRLEMLSMFFVHDGGETQKWRLKGHAQRDFWRWVCSWAVCLGKPGDLGYSNDGYDLPPLNVHEHVLDVDPGLSREAGLLFGFEAKTLAEQRAVRRGSLGARVDRAAALVAADPSNQWLVWCDLNTESEALTKAIPGAVEIRGSDSPEHKEQSILGFVDGRIHHLVTKPSLAGFGVNLQNCAREVFVGVGHSFELWYQATRRVWRFGQTRPVDCHVVTTSADGRVVANLKRKQADAETMRSGMVDHMADLTRDDLVSARRADDNYRPTVAMNIPAWVGQEAS